MLMFLTAEKDLILSVLEEKTLKMKKVQESVMKEKILILKVLTLLELKFPELILIKGIMNSVVV
jgi:hypothetical protein